MWRKTVFRRLSKWLPTDAEVGGATRHERTTLDQVTARDDEAPQLEDSTTTIDAVLSDNQHDGSPSRLDVIEGGLIENDPVNEST